MRLDQRTIYPITEGDYRIWHAGGYGKPNGEIWLDEEGDLRLGSLSVEDCDRLIKAATEIKSKVLAYRAEMKAPHGRAHLYKGTCQLCGKPEDDGLHAEPESAAQPGEAKS